MFELYLICGFLYSLLVYFKFSPPEETAIRNVGDLATLLVTGIGIALMWPLVGYVNHMWKPSGLPK